MTKADVAVPVGPRGPLARALAAEVGRLLLAAAREHPPPWPEPDPTEDPEEPAIVRKARRQRRRQERQDA